MEGIYRDFDFVRFQLLKWKVKHYDFCYDILSKSDFLLYQIFRCSNNLLISFTISSRTYNQIEPINILQCKELLIIQISYTYFTNNDKIDKLGL